ncbi:CIC11C00000000882 [Sungouiella intermedia]|uniref:CIC11C00000000882 n=1 Tax=Sungouiella intermedia TaxID=45354 RepID=A0A1L0D8W5_9ASCO|nr:CIC11C00000000882 [[Candida] intermedia]
MVEGSTELLEEEEGLRDMEESRLMRNRISLTDGKRTLDDGVGDIWLAGTTGGLQRSGCAEVLFTSQCEVYISIASSQWGTVPQSLYRWAADWN